jgi:outer membrane protein assembly factor BamB
MKTLLALSLLLVPLTARAADWPHFLGPKRDSSSTEKVTAWKETPKELWTAEVGEAHSSPIVSKGIVYAFYQPKGKAEDALAAFDAKTGQRKWEKSYERAKFSPPFGNGPRGTPATDGELVFTYGGTGILAAWDAKTGEVQWKLDMLKEFSAKNLFFGISNSPTLVGDHVVVMVGGKGAGLVGVDKKTGKVAWQATNDPASYASAIVVGDDLITLTGSHLRALNGKNGKFRWEFPFKDNLNESSTTPVKVGDIYIASSVTAGTVAVQPNEKGDEVKEIWKDKALTCYFSTPVLVDKHLYMINGAATLMNPTITLRCVEAATGKVAWEKKGIGKYHAALIRTGDNKLLLHDDGGNLTLMEANPKEFQELAKAKVCGPTWAHPALSDGKLYVRDDKKLICIELGK